MTRRCLAQLTWLSCALLVASTACVAPQAGGSRGQAAATEASARDTASRWKELEFTILEDYDKGESLEEIERDFLLFRELGIGTWRGSFGWDDFQPQPGALDVAWLHRFVELAHAQTPARIEITLNAAGGRATEYALDGDSTGVSGFDGIRLRDLRLEPDEPRIFAIAPAP